MTEAKAQSIVEKYSILKDQIITIEGLSYKVYEIIKQQAGEIWEPLLKVFEINESGERKYEHDAMIPLTLLTRNQTSILIYEAEALKFCEFSCVRIIEILTQLLLSIPAYSNNTEIRTKLAQFHDNSQSIYHLENGKAELKIITDFFANEMQRFK